ncbi:unnamed protein product [Trichogramma brassicae]|uniref:Uncharacterized protein n=1 Tax=Trichogramma brassicae TaxID=86971 RepID=A0A6H5INJ9_9HYME|nr:unnamed protein product [Trichogramma brassicae]
MDSEWVVHAQRPSGHRLRDRGHRDFYQALEAPELQMERPYTGCGPFLCHRVRRIGRSRDRRGYGVEPHVRITGACDASMSRVNPRHRREPVYWWTAEIADLQRFCLRARRLSQRSRGRQDEETPQRELPPQGIFCAWRSRPASVGAGGSFATRSTATSGANHTRLPCRACDARRSSSPAPLSWCAARWRLCSHGCRAGPPCSCRVERRSLYRPSPWRNSKELSRGSRSAPRPVRMAYPTQRSKSLLPHDPTSSCGCTRRVWRLAFFHVAESARGLSCFQSQVNPPTSRPRIVRCVCWTHRARFWGESYATGWKLSQRDPEASRSDSMAPGKGNQR